MKLGDVYGAISGRLNRGIRIFNIGVVEDEVEAEDDDIEEVASLLCKNGLARKINRYEYELICDMGQLREFIARKQNEDVSNMPGLGYSIEGDMPLTLEDIELCHWSLPLPKVEENKNNRFARVGLSNHFRNLSNVEARHSLLDNDDDDGDEEDEARIERIIGYIKEMNNYSEEDRSFEPEMRVMFPRSQTILRLKWEPNEDGDVLLHDDECLYNYLLEYMPNKDDACNRDFVTLLLIELETKSQFARRERKITNLLIDIRDKDRFRTEVNYYVMQYGKHLNNLSWLFDAASNDGGDAQASIERKINAFIEEFKANHQITLSMTFSPSVAVRSYLRKIQGIDPRITREQAIDVAERMKEILLCDNSPEVCTSAIRSVIAQLNESTDRSYNVLKLDFYKNM